MKKVIFLIVIATFCFAIDYYAQQTYSPSFPTYRKDIYKVDTASVQTNGLINGLTTTKYYVGKNNTTRKRAIYQWELDNNSIPDGSTINSVRLAFLYSAPGTGVVFPPRFFNVGLDLQNASLTDLWINTDPESQVGISDRSATLDWKFDYTFIPGSDQAFIDAVQNSLDSDKFILGVAWRYEMPSSGNRQWQLHYDIFLEINFTPPTQNVVVDQKLLNNSSVDSIGLWNLFEYKFDKFSVPMNFTWNINDTKTLQGSQKLISNQKYITWLDEPDVINHRTFSIETSTNFLTSQFNPTHSGIKIQNSLEATGIDGGKLEFKDPWLIDYPDPMFGNTLRNRGMAAPFKELFTPYTFTYSSDYKGLFLNQDYNIPGGTFYSLKMPDEQLITVHNQSRKFFPYSWEETGGVTIQYPWAQETGVVFNSSSNVATAVLKGQLMSKEQTGISSNSQRKMVRTDNGIYHVVYESMGSVWYSHSLTSNYFGNWSTDFWAIDHAKNPSLDCEGNTVLVVCEYYDPAITTESELWLFTFNPGGGGLYSMTNYESFANYPSTYFGNAKPVIAFTSGQIFVVYRKNSTEGLKERTKWNTSGNWSWASEASIPQTNANSINPSVAGKFGNMHIVFESLTTIQYKFAYNQGASWRYNNILNLSSGSGFNQNYYPSISISDGANAYVMVSWQGIYTTALDKISAKDDNLGMTRYAAVARVGYGTSWGGFSNFSNNVKYTNNNSINAVAGSILAWSENNGQVSKYVKRRANGLYDPIEPLSTNGIHPIISNGSSFENIKAMVFNTSTSAPYLLNRCNNDFNIELLQKETTEQLISYGRSGVVEKDGIEFLFNIGDVSLNGNTIKFIERVDTLPVTSIEEMNLAAVTETFNLNSSSELIFSNYYYVVNKNLADSLLGENFNLSFKSELVKAQSNEVVGTFDVVSYNKNNLDKYANLSYLVDCAGIESGDYYMRLTTIINEDANLYLSDIQRDDIVLEKAHLLTRNFKGESVPLSYSLEQNYPNPFNPTTTIRYQLPQDGMVTLKVYDILGSEVATLVNELKSAGRYEVNFDASRLASGVYIYKLQAGSYIQSKKMLLVK